MSDMHKACEAGNIEEIRLFVDSGADIEAKNVNGLTPLHVASLYGHIDIVKLLVDLGANVEMKADNSWTPLHYASQNGYIDIVKLLIDSGADIKAISYDDETPARVAETINIKIIIECHEHMTILKEWRPWNHSKYSSGYRKAMKTMVLLAKQLKND